MKPWTDRVFRGKWRLSQSSTRCHVAFFTFWPFVSGSTLLLGSLLGCCSSLRSPGLGRELADGLEKKWRLDTLRLLRRTETWSARLGRNRNRLYTWTRSVLSLSEWKSSSRCTDQPGAVWFGQLLSSSSCCTCIFGLGSSSDWSGVSCSICLADRV